MTELKPCPFCGCKQLDDRVGVQYGEYGTTPVRYFYSIVCAKCGCRTALFQQKGNAVDAWNRRRNDA